MGEQNGAVRESDPPTGSKGGIENQVLLNLDLVLLPADKLPVKLMNYESQTRSMELTQQMPAESLGLLVLQRER